MLLLGLTGGATYAYARGRGLRKQLVLTGDAFADETSRIAAAADEIAVHLERHAEASERLAAARARLDRSRDALEVQLAALREAREAVVRALRLPS